MTTTTTNHLERKRTGAADPTTSVRRVSILDLGHLEIDSSVMSFGLHQARVDDKNLPAKWIGVPLQAILVETNDARILFDTGTHPDSKSRWPDVLAPYEYLVASPEQFLPNRLAQVGLKPTDIDFAVLSHLHMDHSGGIEFLTNAKVLVHRNEFRSALDHYARLDGSPAYVKDDIAGWISNAIQWSPVEPDEDNRILAPGVTVINWGAAHTEGDLGLKIELPESGTLVLCGDACYSSVNLGPPPVLPGSTALWDSQGLLRVARRLERLRSEGAEIWFPHDPDQYATLMKAPEGSYS